MMQTEHGLGLAWVVMVIAIGAGLRLLHHRRRERIAAAAFWDWEEATGWRIVERRRCLFGGPCLSKTRKTLVYRLTVRDPAGELILAYGRVADSWQGRATVTVKPDGPDRRAIA